MWLLLCLLLHSFSLSSSCWLYFYFHFSPFNPSPPVWIFFLKLYLIPHSCSPPHTSSFTPFVLTISQLRKERCTATSTRCRQRTSIVPGADGKKHIILLADSRNICSWRASFLQETRKETMWEQQLYQRSTRNSSLTLHGFLIMFHIPRKSFHLNLQLTGVLLEAKLWWLFSPPFA